MPSIVRGVLAAGCLAGLAAAAPYAQSQTLSQKNVSMEQAVQIVQAAIEFCKESDPRISIAVLDREGLVRLLVRTNGAAPHNLDLARRKAFTAKTFKIPSADFAKRSAVGGELEAQRQLADVIALGGGVPIMIGSDAIGAVGVSGNSQTGDEACAKAGIAKIQGQLN
jgi:uncharacterized protein GlcG (DUF336 family)